MTVKRISGISLFSLIFVLSSLTLTSVAAAPDERPAQPLNTPICSSIITNTTWLAISSPYVICNNGPIAIAQGVTLTIEPGVEVQFGTNSRLNVNGLLSAIGTSSAPITFTGVVTTPGSWQGIGVFGTLSVTNRSVFDHVVIEYAGINVSSGSQLHLEHAAVTLKNSVLRHGKQHGVYGAAKGLAHISDTAFEDHPGYAVYFSDGVVNPVLRRLTASGNGTNGVGLGGFASLTGVHVWEDSGLPYVWAGGAQVALGATLIVEPGVEVQFRQNQSLQIAGKLTAIGQPDRPITFTGSTKSIGWWGGLDVNGDVYNPASAQFDYVTIEYGGIGPNGANLLVTDGQASVAHSIIRHGSPNGVSISARGTGTVIESSQIISHTGYGVRNTVTGPAYAVNAANNWWGHPSGPQTDDGCNVGGAGTRVSTNVIFRPVLTDALALPPIVAPTDARILSLSPRRWFAPADDATRVYFDIVLRDGNGLPASGPHHSLEQHAGHRGRWRRHRLRRPHAGVSQIKHGGRCRCRGRDRRQRRVRIGARAVEPHHLYAAGHCHRRPAAQCRCALREHRHQGCAHARGARRAHDHSRQVDQHRPHVDHGGCDVRLCAVEHRSDLWPARRRSRAR